MAKTIKFTAHVTMTCACGQSCILGEDAQGAIGIVHAEPMCEQFRALNAWQFLTYLQHFFVRDSQQHRRIRPRKNAN